MSNEVRFYKAYDENGCFSNFSEHPVFLEERKWPTSEHYYQAHKYTDPEIMDKVFNAETPEEAARIGRENSEHMRDDWKDVKNDIMKEAVRAKTEQNPDVKSALLATGNAEIIEHTENDAYWGDGGDGSGKNMLGKIWMEVRKRYR